MTEPQRTGGEAASPRELRLLSVVAPVFNEEDAVREFHRRVAAALQGIPFELVLVDDGSSDSSPAILRELRQADDRVRVITLSRNFGHQAALTAGLDYPRGDAAVMLDADLQDPPELIPEMLRLWRSGNDVVFAVRKDRAGETRAKVVTERWFYRLFSKLAQIDLAQNAGDFRLLDRAALDALNSMRERNRFLRGMTVWVGYEQAAVYYDRDARYAGKTKFSPRKMVRFRSMRSSPSPTSRFRPRRSSGSSSPPSPFSGSRLPSAFGSRVRSCPESRRCSSWCCSLAGSS